MALQVAKFELVVKLKVPIGMLQKHLPAPVDSLGEQLAVEVHRQVQNKNLGYYPALDFFIQFDEFPKYLINAVDDVCTLTAEIVTANIREVLIPIFSSVQINDIQCISFAMPSVRFGSQHAIEKLARHFKPNLVKFTLVVSLLKSHSVDTNLEKYANNTVYRWLSETFEDIEISSSRLI